MTSDFSHPFSLACGRIEAEGSYGTGYLISADRVITCAHVVNDHTSISVHFGAAKHAVTHVVADSQSDCAALTISPPTQGITPLQLGGRCRVKADWDGYGFPRVGKGAGLAFAGVVRNPDATDDLGAPTLQLHSHDVADGMAAPLHGFSGSPVVVDGVVVGHLKRVVPDPDHRNRPAYGAIYAVPAIAVSRLIGATPGRPVVQEAMDRRNARHANRVLALWKGWRDAGVGGGPMAVAAAESLIAHGRCDEALEVLTHADEGLRKGQLRALALARRGSIEQAIDVLRSLQERGGLDAETGGLLGGRYKQLWQRSGDNRFLTASYRTYLDTFDATGGSYPGINAAAMSLLRGQRDEARTLAARVLKCRNLRLPPEELDQWELATVAEAHLLLAREEDSREWYERAVALDPMAMENIAVMRRQARIELEALGRPRALLDDVFAIPRVAAFVGHMIDAPDRATPRFPPALQRAVRGAIRSRLQTLQIGYGFSSAARGSDLLFLEELLRRGGRARVLLPFPAAGFREASVGHGWNDRFDRILNDDRVDVTVLAQDVPAESDQPAMFGRCNEKVAERASTFADRLDEEALLLAVWDGRPGDGAGGTADTIDAWRREGRKVEIIDLGGLASVS